MAAIEAALSFLTEGAALILAPAIAGATWDLTQLCNTDPPADPTLTATDLLDITNFVDPTVSIPAVLKARQWFLSWYWYVACQCSATTTPAQPTPSNPGNVTSTNPGLPTGPAVQPCWSVQQLIHTIADAPAAHDVSNLLLPAGTHQTITAPFTGGPTSAPVLPPGVTAIHLHGVGDHAVTAGHGYNLNFKPFNAAGTALSAGIQMDFIGSGPNPLDQTVNWTLPAGTTAVLSWYSSTDIGTIFAEVSFFCAGTSGTQIATPCCPPDPTVDMRLNQMLGLLQAIYVGLPVPLRSLAESTVHSGLTGSGNFATSANAIGCKVSFTVPTQLGEAAGDPTTIFDAGWLTTSAVEGNYRSRRLEHNPELVLFDPVVDTIHYTLHPGVTATITEIVRGP